ncbi:hypothetical protein [Actinocorallia aurantiaca]|uniref:Pycsar effector protein domain-containing protein n=1 Tax=Actinocorallia aurantiaca TaxID=46204 RepID=A0ABN3USV5_9ACTN
MTDLRSSDPARSSHLPAALPVEEQLERVNWHILRSDQMRTGVSARAGAVLSTNALLIAGIALAFSLRNQKPDTVLVVIALVVLGCVVFSVGNAALALVTVRNWESQFGEPETPAAFLYCYAELDKRVSTFDEFRHKVVTTSPEESLEFALAELWRCGRLHGYRYRRLRSAMLWLLAALFLLLVAAAASALR